MDSAAEQHGFPFEAVVLVADLLDGTVPYTEAFLRRDLEKTPSYVLAEISEAVAKLGLQLHHYVEPAELAGAAARHKDDIVLSIYGGERSRNRMALVPAICETFSLRYIGPDAYGRLVCQDKEISKRLAGEAGLNTPDYLIIRDEHDLPLLRSFTTPYVLKPLWEGSSIGIGPENLVCSGSEGVRLAERLIGQLRQPLMVEAFVPGIEVNVSLIQLSQRTEIRLTEVFMPGDPNYFASHLFDADEKLLRNPRVQNRTLPLGHLSDSDQIALSRLVEFVGGVGYARIDGKLHGDRFHFLELTPDAWLGASGSFVSSFLQGGWTYQDVMKAVLLSRRA